MKTLNTKLALLAITFFTIATNISCSKNDDPIVTPLPVVLAPLQDPLQGYLVASGFNEETITILNNLDRELGYSFIPLVNGKITAVVVKIPDTRSALKVTIWDKTTATVLRTETIDITSSGVETIKIISPLDLIKDKEYFVSMNSNDYYYHKKANGSDVTYPFIVGDIKVTSYAERPGVVQQLIPNFPGLSGYIGDCSFKFQK
jgi:Domain of unknown function (DUF4082)